MRRRASSLAATIRARDAISSACVVAFEIAVATSSVNSATRTSACSGSGAELETTTIAPHTRPSATIGAPATDSEAGLSGPISAIAPSNS